MRACGQAARCASRRCARSTRGGAGLVRLARASPPPASRNGNTPTAALMPESIRWRANVRSGGDVRVEAAIGKALAHLDAYRACSSTVVPARSFERAGCAGGDGSTLRAALEENSCAALGPQAGVRARCDCGSGSRLRTDGALLSVAPRHGSKSPSISFFIASEGAPKLAVTQNTVAIGDGAEVQLVETHAASGESQALAYTRLMPGAMPA